MGELLYSAARRDSARLSEQVHDLIRGVTGNVRHFDRVPGLAVGNWLT
jgi:hypothetical protein